MNSPGFLSGGVPLVATDLQGSALGWGQSVVVGAKLTRVYCDVAWPAGYSFGLALFAQNINYPNLTATVPVLPITSDVTRVWFDLHTVSGVAEVFGHAQIGWLIPLS